jgi:hypothetical protein
MVWEERVYGLTRKEFLRRYYKMDVPCFEGLAEKLRPHLEPKKRREH